MAAMYELRDGLGPGSGPIDAVTEVALPRMKNLTDELEKLYDHAN